MVELEASPLRPVVCTPPRASPPLPGSTALAYEPDVAVVLNDKMHVSSKAHLACDATRVEELRRRVVLSVEKNPDGISRVDHEFGKDFANYRFDPQGAWATKRLWTEGSVDE
jgi:replicative DNA helicase